LTPTPRGGGVLGLFQDQTDRATTGTVAETLLSKTVTAYILKSDGDRIRIVCAGIFAANANQKLFWLSVFGTVFSGLDTTQSGGSWHVSAELIRSGSSTVRASIVSRYGTSSVTEYQSVTATLSSDQVVLFRGRSPTTTGDLTLKFVGAEFIGASA